MASTEQEKGDCLAVSVFYPLRKEKGDFKGNLEVIRAATLVTGLEYKGSLLRQQFFQFLQETVMFLTSADLHSGAAFPENCMIRVTCQPRGVSEQKSGLVSSSLKSTVFIPMSSKSGVCETQESFSGRNPNCKPKKTGKFNASKVQWWDRHWMGPYSHPERGRQGKPNSGT